MRRYLYTLLGILSVVLTAVLVMNLALGARSLGSAEATRQASQWQQATKGVTYAPPISLTLPFKALRLADRLPEVNAVVLGSSALMGITERLFPDTWRVYNLTFAGNATSATAAQAEYVERHLSGASGRVTHMLVGLDWSVGNLYALAPDGVLFAGFTLRRNCIAHNKFQCALVEPSCFLTTSTISPPKIRNASFTRG